MKKIFTLLLVVFALAGYSQDTINYVWKRQPFKVSKIAYADTMFLSGESPYGAYGSLFSIDSTSDGRYFINDGYAVNDSLTQIRSEISDTATQIRSEIVDTANQIRAEVADTAVQLRSDISDSTYFDFNGYLEVESAENDSLFIGASGGGTRALNTTLQVAGQFNITPSTFDLSSDSIYNASNGNIVFSSGSGNLVSISKCAIGSIIVFKVDLGGGLQIDPADFLANGQSIYTLSGGILTLDEYDIVSIMCIDVGVFAVAYQSGDNQ